MRAIKSLSRFTANGLYYPFETRYKELKLAYDPITHPAATHYEYNRPTRDIIPKSSKRFAANHFYSWVERGTFESGITIQEHNTLTWLGFELRPFDQRPSARSIGWLRLPRMKPVMLSQTLYFSPTHFFGSLEST